ncbi:hypothetical protein PROFUN_00856 [Planoprotostelium fungivorum]|uniref:Uncharacterized protein n=1 Tax=Planoprotostelium fungivorum TaxID=1890364 RepID=A0A2P6P059_9EUKA|nr:hypothetical protein PROFUN_00856 [Planoprotostelium fungivorum]
MLPELGHIQMHRMIPNKQKSRGARHKARSTAHFYINQLLFRHNHDDGSDHLSTLHQLSQRMFLDFCPVPFEEVVVVHPHAEGQVPITQRAASKLTKDATWHSRLSQLHTVRMRMDTNKTVACGDLIFTRFFPISKDNPAPLFTGWGDLVSDLQLTYYPGGGEGPQFPSDFRGPEKQKIHGDYHIVSLDSRLMLKITVAITEKTGWPSHAWQVDEAMVIFHVNEVERLSRNEKMSDTDSVPSSIDISFHSMFGIRSPSQFIGKVNVPVRMDGHQISSDFLPNFSLVQLKGAGDIDTKFHETINDFDRSTENFPDSDGFLGISIKDNDGRTLSSYVKTYAVDMKPDESTQMYHCSLRAGSRKITTREGKDFGTRKALNLPLDFILRKESKGNMRYRNVLFLLKSRCVNATKKQWRRDVEVGKTDSKIGEKTRKTRKLSGLVPKRSASGRVSLVMNSSSLLFYLIGPPMDYQAGPDPRDPDPFLDSQVLAMERQPLILTVETDDTKEVARYCDKEKQGSAVRFRYIAQSIILCISCPIPRGAYLIAELYDKKAGTRLGDNEQRMLIFRMPRQPLPEENEVLRYNRSTVYKPRRHAPSEDGKFKLSFGMLSPTTFFQMEERVNRQLFVKCTIYSGEETQTYDTKPFYASKENSKRRRSQ